VDEPRVNNRGAIVSTAKTGMSTYENFLAWIPMKVSFRLVDLSLNNQFYWIQADEQNKIFYESQLDADVADNTILLLQQY